LIKSHTELASVPLRGRGIGFDFLNLLPENLMNPVSESRFNLGYVLRETGIKPDTLRAWERRYGLPQPERTEGGHRLYSWHDIETVRWLLAQQEQGLSISKAVKLWNSLQSDGQDPLQSLSRVEALREETPAVYQVSDVPSLEELRQAWIQACLRFDNAGAESALSRAFTNYPMKDVLSQVLQRGLAEVGNLWFDKNATIQQEHFASALALQRLHTLIADAPAPSLHGRVLIGGTANEAHEFAPLLINLLLRYRGWDVIYLGANVPEIQLEATLQKTRAQLVVLTAEQLHTAANLLDAALFLKEQKVQLGYGGAIFNHLPELRQRIPGHFLGTRIEDAVGNIEELLIRQPPTPDHLPAPLDHLDALKAFQEKQGLIETDLREVEQPGLSAERVRMTNFYLSRNIEAALRLGDIHFVEREIDWANGLMANASYDPQQMLQFLQSYGRAMGKHLDQRGQLILTWAQDLITRT
jgi:DNA-binding transcriptional MerR regulator/methylmalonyl-CoA mutase cobalamin-binding subunit